MVMKVGLGLVGDVLFLLQASNPAASAKATASIEPNRPRVIDLESCTCPPANVSVR